MHEIFFRPNSIGTQYVTYCTMVHLIRMRKIYICYSVLSNSMFIGTLMSCFTKSASWPFNKLPLAIFSVIQIQFSNLMLSFGQKSLKVVLTLLDSTQEVVHAHHTGIKLP